MWHFLSSSTFTWLGTSTPSLLLITCWLQPSTQEFYMRVLKQTRWEGSLLAILGLLSRGSCILGDFMKTFTAHLFWDCVQNLVNFAHILTSRGGESYTSVRFSRVDDHRRAAGRTVVYWLGQILFEINLLSFKGLWYMVCFHCSHRHIGPF